MDYVSFEKPIFDVQHKINELKSLSISTRDFDDEIKLLERELTVLKTEIYKSLTPFQKCQMARHPHRPYMLDYVGNIFDQFIELHGDRNFGDDTAVVGGVASFEGKGVMVIGHQKGKGTKNNVYRNFGMPRPEGYRKAIRLMKMAERFSMPIITFIDTPGAYPGIEAEQRGQAEAIASNLLVMSQIKVPIVSFVIGEGGSGGALALGVCNHLVMLEFSIYSVISPEGCASILWRDALCADQAADSLKLTSKDLLKLEIADEVINEPLGSVHNDFRLVSSRISDSIKKNLAVYDGMSGEEIADHRQNKIRIMGVFDEANNNRY